MKRIKLCNRKLPAYTMGEEIMNMVTHIVGGAMAIVITILCVLRAVRHENTLGLIGSVIYGFTMITTYTISSVYHGLRTVTSKKVLQILDHCAIYFLISGTYTPILLSAFVPNLPALGWAGMIFQWGLAIFAATLTAIDLRRYRVISMVCYIAMGWSIIFFVPQLLQVAEQTAFSYLLAGGISYTIGAILYGIGSKKHWMHSVFHIFVVLGSFLQFIAIYGFIL